MYKLLFKKTFNEDIKNIKNYIFKHSFSLESSNKLSREIMWKILWLKIFPYMYPEFLDSFRVLTIRKKYRVFYKVDKKIKKVVIYYVFWSEEDYDNLIH